MRSLRFRPNLPPTPRASRLLPRRRRSLSAITPLLVALVLSGTWQPAPVAGAGPSSAPSVAAVPPRDPAGPIRLPNGRLLPNPPAGAVGPSEMASELAAHASDRLTFTPGSQPRDLGPGGAATLALASGTGAANAILIPLATGSPTATLASLPNGLKKQVIGFLPYWMLTASNLQWLRYDLVSTIAYFGVAVRSDGSLTTTGSTWTGWNSSAMTGVINAAHSRGDKVVLTVTMMAWDSASASAQATLLGSSTYRTRLVNNIVATITNRHADGVNLDFEPLSSTLRSQYTSFVRQLKAALVAAERPALTVCTTAGAATWATGYDVAALTASGAADAIFVMGYDFSWSGSSRAGGVDPMASSYMLDVNQAVTDFLSLTSGAKLIWGVPYYGRTWHTTSSALNAATVSGASGQSKAYYYTGSVSLASAHGRKWDSLGQGPWFAYYDSTAASWIEGYYDDAVSLGVRYDMINRRGLAGMGMWHLLMDAGVSDLWNLIANKFQKDTMPPSGGVTNLPAVTDASAIGVSWRAIDVGAGLASYTVQVRDRATSTWATWISGTTTTAATYLGQAGHAYEFRVSAKDKLGNTQPWVAAMPNPGSALALGGFGRVTSDLLNVRAGAGTTFDQLSQLSAGQRVAVLAGPVAAGGYQWYQVQFAFGEWPSADYPRTGWVASGDGTTAWVVPDVAPTVTTLQPWVSAYTASPRVFSPNGDGRADSVSVGFSLAGDASDVRLDVLNGQGTVVDTTDLGAMTAGAHAATWDGRLAGGAWAGAGSYLVRVVASAGGVTHVAPTNGTNLTILGRWGVTADLTPPSATGSPTGQNGTSSSGVHATFSEPASGVGPASFTLWDTTTSAPVAGTVSYAASTRVATLQPSAALAIGHTYRATLASTILDLAGNPLPATAWTFSVPNAVWTYSPARTLSFAAGSHTGYRFDSTGKVTASKTYTLGGASTAATTIRSRMIPGHPAAYFYVTNGVWAGYWLPESPTVYLRGIAEQVIYDSPRPVSFAAGTYTGVQFSSTWAVSSSKAYRLSQASSASASRWAVINGRPYVLIQNGVWAGYWMATGGGVTVS